MELRKIKKSTTTVNLWKTFVTIFFPVHPKNTFLRLYNVPRRIRDERDNPILRPSTRITPKNSSLWQERPVVFQTKSHFFSVNRHHEFVVNFHRVVIEILTSFCNYYHERSKKIYKFTIFSRRCVYRIRFRRCFVGLMKSP